MSNELWTVVDSLLVAEGSHEEPVTDALQVDKVSSIDGNFQLSVVRNVVFQEELQLQKRDPISTIAN